MKFIWNVSNTKSIKWAYSLVISVLSFKRYYPDDEYIIYYDTDDTRAVLEQYLDGVSYIKDDGWTDGFCKRTFSFTNPFGSGCFNIFRAIEDYSDFFFLDCDCLCSGKIEFTKTNRISAMKRLNVPFGFSRCAIYVDGKIDFKASDVNMKTFQMRWGDEILFKQLFLKITSPTEFKNLRHYGTEPWRFKTQTTNFTLFNKMYNDIKDGKDILPSDFSQFQFK